MKLIPLTQGYSAMVDDADFEWLMQWKWCARIDRKKVYASRNAKDENMKWRTLPMHRFIMGVTDPKIEVDHKFGNGLDNQRKNLRICTKAQNQMNSGGWSKSVSKYKGVCWSRIGNKWVASIRFKGKSEHLGLFDSEILAAEAYDAKAIELFGSYAFLNFSNTRNQYQAEVKELMDAHLAVNTSPLVIMPKTYEYKKFTAAQAVLHFAKNGYNIKRYEMNTRNERDRVRKIIHDAKKGRVSDSRAKALLEQYGGEGYRVSSVFEVAIKTPCIYCGAECREENVFSEEFRGQTLTYAKYVCTANPEHFWQSGKQMDETKKIETI